MRLDPTAHQATNHEPRSISGISHQSPRLKTKALFGSPQHCLGGGHFSPPARRRGFDVNDDRQFVVDQIIRAIRKAEF